MEDSGPEEERFIVDLNFNKRSFNIPWMVGINSEEMLFKTAGKLYYQYIHVNGNNKQCILYCKCVLIQNSQRNIFINH